MNDSLYGAVEVPQLTPAQQKALQLAREQVLQAQRQRAKQQSAMKRNFNRDLSTMGSQSLSRRNDNENSGILLGKRKKRVAGVEQTVTDEEPPKERLMQSTSVAQLRQPASTSRTRVQLADCLHESLKETLHQQRGYEDSQAMSFTQMVEAESHRNHEETDAHIPNTVLKTMCQTRSEILQSPQQILFRCVLGSVLRCLRTSHSMTLREVSDNAGVSLGYLSEVERGHKEASSELLLSITRALSVNLSDVLRVVADYIGALEQDHE